jgi:hypothetical protein
MKNIEEYFGLGVRSIFDSAIQVLGGQEVAHLSPAMVRYEGLDWFVECFVLLEEGPRYCPRVHIGPLPERGLMIRDRQMDILHATPIDSPLRRYNLIWRYSSAEELNEIYSKVRDLIFLPYAVPLLRNNAKLVEAIQRHSEEVNSRWQKETEDHNSSIIRRKAATAWTVKDYPGFISEMEKLPSSSLTESEKHKLDYARKQ